MRRPRQWKLHHHSLHIRNTTGRVPAPTNFSRRRLGCCFLHGTSIAQAKHTIQVAVIDCILAAFNSFEVADKGKLGLHFLQVLKAFALWWKPSKRLTATSATFGVVFLSHPGFGPMGHVTGDQTRQVVVITTVRVMPILLSVGTSLAGARFWCFCLLSRASVGCLGSFRLALLASVLLGDWWCGCWSLGVLGLGWSFRGDIPFLFLGLLCWSRRRVNRRS